MSTQSKRKNTGQRRKPLALGSGSALGAKIRRLRAAKWDGLMVNGAAMVRVSIEDLYDVIQSHEQMRDRLKKAEDVCADPSECDAKNNHWGM